jgi:inosose dehydratase
MGTAGPVRFGVAPIAWSNSDLPELGGDTSLETCLADSRAAGFSGTETGVKFPMDPASLGPILERHSLALVSGWFSGRLLELSVTEEKRRLEQQLACFAALGAPVMVYAETTGSLQADRTTPVSRRPRLAPEDFSALGAKLTEIAEHMAGRGVPMAYHPHMGTVVETDEDIDRLMAATGPAVGLLVDTGHVAYAGGDWLAVTERHAARLVHVHCKDVRPDVLAKARSDDLSFLDAVVAGVFTVPGDGFIDYHAFARLLAKVGYSGWVVVEAEQDPAKAPPFTYAKIGHAHLSETFSAAGFEIVD